MLENSLGLQVLAGTRRNHTAEEEPDLGELSELLEREHRGGRSEAHPNMKHEWRKKSSRAGGSLEVLLRDRSETQPKPSESVSAICTQHLHPPPLLLLLRLCLPLMLPNRAELIQLI